jgi:hypothetical protein
MYNLIKPRKFAVDQILTFGFFTTSPFLSIAWKKTSAPDSFKQVCAAKSASVLVSDCQWTSTPIFVGAGAVLGASIFIYQFFIL